MQLKKRIRRNWGCWRLILSKDGAFDAEAYDYVFNRMTPQEVLEANLALDIIQKEMKKRARRRR